MFRLTKKILGERSEAMAKRYLEQQGLIYVTGNFLCRRGEIDLIMKDGHQLVFIEVRFRSRENHGTAIDTINFKKQKRIILAAQYYLHKHQLTEKISCRFDVVAVDNSAGSYQGNTQTNSSHSDNSNGKSDGKKSSIQWLKNAFNTDSIATIY